MKQLSKAARVVVAMYLALVLLALLFVPVHGNRDYNPGFVFLWGVLFGPWYINFEVLRWEILILTVAAALALTLVSLVAKKPGDNLG